MKILITGGAGFIGSNIAKAALQAGHQVHILDNLQTGYQENLAPLDVQFTQGDIRDQKLVEDITQGKDCIVHCAASVGNVRSLENPLEDAEVNYLGTINVLEAMKKNAVPKIVYSSSSAGYGEPQYLPNDEAHPLNPDSPYGVSKIAAEKLILSYGRNFNFQAVCLRYFNAYGENQRYDAYGNVIPIFCTKLLKKEALTIFGDGLQTRDFIHVGDIARANVLALESSVSGAFNVATGKSVELNYLVELLKGLVDYPVETKHLPFRKGEVKHSSADISKVSEALNFQPEISLEEGLKSYFSWFKKLS